MWNTELFPAQPGTKRASLAAVSCAWCAAVEPEALVPPFMGGGGGGGAAGRAARGCGGRLVRLEACTQYLQAFSGSVLMAGKNVKEYLYKID